MFAQVSKLFEQLFNNSSESIYLHGTVVHKCITGEPLKHNDLLQIFCPFIPKGDITELIKDIPNIQILKKYRYMHADKINSDVPNLILANYLLDEIQLFLEFHTHEDSKFMFDTDNVVLTRNGISLWNEAFKSKYSVIDLLSTFRNICSKQCTLLRNYSNISSDFEIIINQERKIKEGFVVKNGFQSTQKEESCPVCFGFGYLYVLNCTHKFCASCIDKHKCSFGLAHKDDCPICRQPIVFASPSIN